MTVVKESESQSQDASCETPFILEVRDGAMSGTTCGTHNDIDGSDTD